jgi:long-chain acyl-CoA synthetase
VHLGQVAALTPDKPAVIMAGSGEVVTFRELDEESNRLAQLLRAEGLRPGDHVAFMLENHRSFLAVAWAAQRSGLYYTAISSRLRADEVAYVIANCGARVFISSARLGEVAVAVSERTPGVKLRLMLDGTAPGFESYEERIAGRPATPLEDECEGADMLYSSGTTGRPKGVKPALSRAPRRLRRSTGTSSSR